jgi:hypothetical protein
MMKRINKKANRQIVPMIEIANSLSDDRSSSRIALLIN